jgi:glycosyltransferase involved in cell wall biosynthesis
VRILQLSPGYPPDPGGVERHVQEISEALVRLGHEVTVLALGDPGAAAGPARSPSDGPEVLRVPARTVGPFLLPAGLRRRLTELARSHDVLHVHNYHSPLPLVALGAASGIPVLVSPHFHGGGHTPLARLAHPVYQRLFRSVLPRAAGLVFVSAAELERFRREFGDPVPGVVVHNGVRPAPPGGRPTGPGPTGPEADPLVLSVGRLERYKRVDLLVQALAALPMDRRWRAVVVGDGPELPRLRALVGRLAEQGAGHLPARIRFAGRVDDPTLDRLLGTARLTVSTSEHEAFGMAALDAVAAGCPVLASDLPAHRELTGLAPGWIRLWHPDRGTAALAAMIDTALAGPGPVAPAPPALPTWDRAAEQLAARYAEVGRAHTAGRRRFRSPA